MMGQTVSTGYGLGYLLFAALRFLPALRAVVRRLHELGKSGWMYLIL